MEENFIPVGQDELVTDLTAAEQTVSGWIENQVEYFDPLNWTTPEERHLRRKAFAESALYLYAIDNVPGQSAEDLAPTLNKHVRTRTNDERYYQLIQRYPRNIIKYAFPVNYIKSRNELDEPVIETVDRTIRRTSVWATERLPFRLMDLWYFCQLYGYDDHDYHPENILQYSAATCPPNIINSTLTDAYALTHDILFYCNFGVEDPSFPSGPAPYDVESTLSGLLIRFMGADNPDIVLELVLTGVVQQQLSPSIVRVALTWVLQKLDSNGFVPGPENVNPIGIVPSDDATDLDELDTEVWDDSKREWAEHYHTNLVAGTVFRVVRDRWPSISTQSSELVFEEPSACSELFSLGRVLNELARYELYDAAERMLSLTDDDLVRRYPVIVNTIAEYFKSQRTQSGEYGIWTDEQRLYNSLDKSEPFDTEMQQPLTEMCEAVVSAIKSSQ